MSTLMPFGAHLVSAYIVLQAATSFSTHDAPQIEQDACYGHEK